jgi:hypothetical protein
MVERDLMAGLLVNHVVRALAKEVSPGVTRAKLIAEVLVQAALKGDVTAIELCLAAERNHDPVLDNVEDETEE